MHRAMSRAHGDVALSDAEAGATMSPLRRVRRRGSPGERRHGRGLPCKARYKPASGSLSRSSIRSLPTIPRSCAACTRSARSRRARRIPGSSRSALPAGRTDDIPYLVMEYLDGRTLAHIIDDGAIDGRRRHRARRADRGCARGAPRGAASFTATSSRRICSCSPRCVGHAAAGEGDRLRRVAPARRADAR